MYAHLHVHSNYSLREGAAHVTDLANTAAEMGMEALALTDHDGMYGAVRFTLACRQAGIRPILGAELEWGDGYHVTLLAMDTPGWSNLCRLVTEMHLEERMVEPGRRPRTTFDAIATHSEGLFALSGCPKGEIPWMLTVGRTDDAEAATRRWRDVFGPRFAIELNNQLGEGDVVRNQKLVSLATRHGLRTVATNNVHYVTPRDAVVHDVLDCMRRIVPLNRRTAPRTNAEYWLKPAVEMAALHPPEAIEGAAWVAEQCRYEFPMGQFHFPDIATERGESPTQVLAKRCWDGLRRRYPNVTREIDDRLQRELRMIRKGGFCGYFVLVADIVEHAKKVMGIRCSCRGSAAGALVSFALGISDVDPVRYDLVFERFMNEHRREIPDIDVDFESARREDVNQYILDTYGDRTAMVAMMETYRARGALREVGKALGLHLSEIDSIARAFPHVSARNIPQALDSLPEVAGLNLKASKLEMLFELATRIDAYPRHLAMHPSGVILSDERLADLMPMQRSFQGFLMSQYDKDDIEALGIAKLDVLGVRMFSTIAHTMQEIARIDGTVCDIDAVARDDPETFDLIKESRTLGCFQIESPGQRELLGKFQPEEFGDLIVDISLFRPGPMKADMIRPFLDRRMGFSQVTYGDPRLKWILKETNGVIVFHEQVMRVIAELTGCSLGEADKIRRGLPDAPARSDSDPLKAEVIAKAISLGWAPKVAAKIWDEVVSFASFGFCKAHAAAFAVPTYQSAWLKQHYPVEFYSGVLTHDPGMYPRRAILADARAHGVAILPLDVNASFSDYRVEVAPAPVGQARRSVGLQPVGFGFGSALEGVNVEAEVAHGPAGHALTTTDPHPEEREPNGSPCTPDQSRAGQKAIRIGLQDVSGIKGEEIAAIIGGRPWKGFNDFCRRAEVSRPVVEALIHCGAFDGIKGKRSRRELFWIVEERWVARTRARAEQMSLAIDDAEQVVLPGIREYSEQEKVQAELEVTGMDASQHLIEFYREDLKRLGWTPASELLTKRSNATVVVAGVKVATQTPPTKSGKRVIFLTLEDGTGQSDCTFFEEAQGKYARTVFDGWILAVRGKVRRTGLRGVSILAEDVIDLKKMKSPGKLWFASPGSAGG